MADVKKVTGQVSGDAPHEGEKVVRPSMLNAETAPFIGFEAIGASRASDGLYTIAMVASKVIPYSDGRAESVAVCAGYLKGTEAAMLALRKAIDDVLLLGRKTEGPAN